MKSRQLLTRTATSSAFFQAIKTTSSRTQTLHTKDKSRVRKQVITYSVQKLPHKSSPPTCPDVYQVVSSKKTKQPLEVLQLFLDKEYGIKATLENEADGEKFGEWALFVPEDMEKVLLNAAMRCTQAYQHEYEQNEPEIKETEAKPEPFIPSL